MRVGDDHGGRQSGSFHTFAFGRCPPTACLCHELSNSNAAKDKATNYTNRHHPVRVVGKGTDNICAPGIAILSEFDKGIEDVGGNGRL